MKLFSALSKNFLGVIVVLFFTACGNDGEKNAPGAETSAEEAKETTSTAATTNNLSQDPVYKKGLSLIAKSDCLTCHKIDEKLVGPTYRDVAEKYAGAPNDVITALANKIIKGGVGNWGNVPMLPHPAISQDDAETMVRYILMLKK